MEVWGGNLRVEKRVEVPGLDWRPLRLRVCAEAFKEVPMIHRPHCLTLAISFLLALPLAAGAKPPTIDDLLANARSASGAGEGDLDVSARFTAPSAGRPAELSITAVIPAPWHIYSLTQPSGGPLATKIKLAPSFDYTLKSSFSADPGPKVHTDPTAYGDLPLEEHSGQVTWRATIEMAHGVDPATLKIRGTVRAQRCAESCLAPKDFTFVATVAEPSQPVARGPAPTPAAPPTTAAEVARPASGEYRTGKAHVVIRGNLSRAVVVPGGRAELTLSAEPDRGFHVYALAPRESGIGGKPTLIVLTDTAKFRYGSFSPSSKPLEVAEPPPLDGVARYYESPIEWTSAIEIPADTPAGEYQISGLIGFQTCSEASCDFPQAASFTGTLKVGATEQPGRIPIVFHDAKYAEVAAAAETSASANPHLSATSLTGGAKSSVASAAHTAPAGDRGGFDEARVQVADEKIGFWGIMLRALLGGLILNAMPCVFPVIGLKILSFVEQSHQHRGRVFVLNVWYSLGVIALFLGLATVAIVLRPILPNDFKYGQQNGIDGFNIAMAALMFVMGLSLLGVWEIPIPGFLGSGRATEIASQEGAVGAFSKGILTTLLGASCSGPLVGIAFAFALDRGTAPVAAFLTFACIGLGMSSPYLVIGAMPRLLRFLPRPGAWMETFKQFVGFVMLGAMVFTMTYIGWAHLVPTVAFLVGLGMACWWVGRMPLTAGPAQRLSARVGALGVAGMAWIVAFGWLDGIMADRFDEHLNEQITARTHLPADSALAGAERPGEANFRLAWLPFSKDCASRFDEIRQDGHGRFHRRLVLKLQVSRSHGVEHPGHQATRGPKRRRDASGGLHKDAAGDHRVADDPQERGRAGAGDLSGGQSQPADRLSHALQQAGTDRRAGKGWPIGRPPGQCGRSSRSARGSRRGRRAEHQRTQNHGFDPQVPVGDQRHPGDFRGRRELQCPASLSCSAPRIRMTPTPADSTRSLQINRVGREDRCRLDR